MNKILLVGIVLIMLLLVGCLDDKMYYCGDTEIISECHIVFEKDCVINPNWAMSEEHFNCPSGWIKVSHN